MGKKIVIMFPCVGRRVVLVEAFRKACKKLHLQPFIVGTDIQDNSPALNCCDKQYIVKPVADPRYARQAVNIALKEKADLVVPTVDLDLGIWAKNRKRLAKNGCTALIAQPETVAICGDKRKTFQFLTEHGFDTPKTMTAEQALKLKHHKFPYFLKPWDGHASRGNAVVNDRESLRFYAGKRIPNCLIQEFIPGKEFTVDVFVDFQGNVRCVVPRQRLEVRAGEVSKGVTVKNRQIMLQSQKLVEALQPGPGLTTIQCILTKDNKIKFIEINPRFGGGAPLAIKAGANYPLWIIKLWLGQNPRIKIDAWREGLLMMRYDEAIWRQT